MLEIDWSGVWESRRHLMRIMLGLFQDHIYPTGGQTQFLRLTGGVERSLPPFTRSHFQSGCLQIPPMKSGFWPSQRWKEHVCSTSHTMTKTHSRHSWQQEQLGNMLVADNQSCSADVLINVVQMKTGTPNFPVWCANFSGFLAIIILLSTISTFYTCIWILAKAFCPLRSHNFSDSFASNWENSFWCNTFLYDTIIF